jgi:hypothetical protein
MLPEIKSWVKPHLRARLIAEAAEKAEKPPTQGLTPVAAITSVTVGDSVRLQKPANCSEGPRWTGHMDHLDGQLATVTEPMGYIHDEPDWFKATDVTGTSWVLMLSWVVEKI